jgi:3-dehydro-4-phosphotetronate decarboxylase
MMLSPPAEICRWALTLFALGLSPGSSGNISLRENGRVWITPTNSCLGFLEPGTIACLEDGRLVSGNPPSKELPLHMAVYRARPKATAVVHLHSSYAVALSCRADINPASVLPAISPYAAIRLGPVPLVPYATPGSGAIVPAVEEALRNHLAVLIANHGPVVSGTTLEHAVFAAEEFEETAKLAHLLDGKSVALLGPDELARLAALRPD